jgi:2-dehydro-3-deoxyglucarate aldolase
MPHSFRERLLRGDVLVGPMVCLSSPEVVEILCGAGFDWLFLEAEHAPATPQSLQHMMIAAGDTPCVVRLPNHDEIWVKRALDMGAAGVIVPQVNSAEQAREVVRFAKYAPVGQRGVGVSRAHGYGYAVVDYIARANQDTAVIVQAEHIDAVKNIEAITDVPGLDAVLIGPYDLSASMGKMGRVNDPEVVEAISVVARTAKRKNLKLGFFGVSVDAVKPYVESGFTLIAAGVDTMLLGQAASLLCKTLKGDASAKVVVENAAKLSVVGL